MSTQERAQVRLDVFHVHWNQEVNPNVCNKIKQRGMEMSGHSMKKNKQTNKQTNKQNKTKQNLRRANAQNSTRASKIQRKTKT